MDLRYIGASGTKSQELNKNVEVDSAEFHRNIG